MINKRKIKKEWDEFYGNFPLESLSWHSERPAKPLIDILNRGSIKRGRALDICSGAGTNAVYLAAKGFSVAADLKIIRPGYVPTGGGIIEINVKPQAQKIAPLRLIEQGKLIKIEGISISSHLSERKVSQRMADGCNKVLGKRGLQAEIELINDTKATQRGAALSIWAKTDSGCIIGADRAGKIGRTSEAIGTEVAKNLLEDLDSGATVDRYTADQLILYAALADGESEYFFPHLTEHIESNLWLVKDILGVEIFIEGNRLKIKGRGIKGAHCG